MTRRTQYRFLLAGSVAVAWLALSVYLGLDRPALRGTVAVPMLWIRALGLGLAPIIGRSVAALVAIVTVWGVVTAVLFGLAEGWVWARRLR